MSDNKNLPEMEDISSTSDKYRAIKNKINVYSSLYSNGIYANLGNVIKIISFVLGFGVIILSLLLAFFLFSKTSFGIVLSFAAIIFGTLIAACVFFPLFGLGHLICQNDEILKRLDD